MLKPTIASSLRIFLSAAAFLLLAVCAFAADAEPRRGEVVFQSDFEAADSLSHGESAKAPGVRLVPGYRGTQSLSVERPAAEGVGQRSIRIRLPIEKLRGTRVKVEAVAKADAFREWDGWSVEHGPDPNDHKPAATPTDRERLLRSWFGKRRIE